MSEEKIKILDMLRDGNITTEEAMELLKQVSEDTGSSRRYQGQDSEQWRFNPIHKLDFSWINDLRSSIEETTRNTFFSEDFPFGTKREHFTTSLNVDSSIRALVFEGKNAPMKLETYGGDKIEVEAYYKAKNRWDPHLTLTEENGSYSLNYDDNVLYVLGINIRVPETAHIGSIHLKNRNAPISVNDIKAEKIGLNTKNESIKISDTKGDSLYCKTKNATIVLDDVKMREIDVQTSNSRISLDGVEAFQTQLVTSNAKIDIKNSVIVQIYAKTSEYPLRFDNLGYMDHESGCSINAITTNGQISINLPHRELTCKIRATTTSDGIFTELKDLVYQVNERNYVEAQGIGYETAKNKLNLNLQTTNYGIYIK